METNAKPRLLPWDGWPEKSDLAGWHWLEFPRDGDRSLRPLLWKDFYWHLPTGLRRTPNQLIESSPIYHPIYLGPCLTPSAYQALLVKVGTLAAASKEL